MSPNSGYACQQPIEHLATFSNSLAQAVKIATRQTPGLENAVRKAITAECVQCAMRVSGDDLLALGAGISAASNSRALRRLQEGYCARRGCDSYYYRLVLPALDGADWNELLTASGSTSSDDPEAAPAAGD